MTIHKKVNIITDIRGHVLDDDKEFNGLVAEIFRLNGLVNIFFYDNTQVFLSETNENVHLCVIDLNTDEGALAGLGVARIIKDRYPKAKIIMTSSTPTAKVYEDMIDLGVDGFVNKDLNWAEYQDRAVKVVQKSIADIRDSLELALLLEEDRKLRKPKTQNEGSNA